MSEVRQLRTAIAALKVGRPVRIDSDEPLTIVSVETAARELLELLDPNSTAPLLISGWRAASLALANRREAADPTEPVLVERSDWLDLNPLAPSPTRPAMRSGRRWGRFSQLRSAGSMRHERR